MALTTEKLENGNGVKIMISGRFDFHLHRDFRNSYKDLDGAVSKFVIDLRNTEFMDSSALGMLLLLREYANEHDCSIDIVNANPTIRKILAVSNFRQLFNVV